MSQDVQEIENADEGSSRRSLLAKGAMAAAVATVAGLAMSRETDAANNGPLLMGVATNSATLTTTLTGGSTLKVVDGTTDGNGAVKASIYGRSTISGNAGVLGESVTTEGGRGVWGRNASDVGVGVYGSNNSSGGIGVYGESTDTGNSDGVVGKSSGGNGVVGRGTLADFFADGNGRIVLNKAGIATPAAGATPIGTIGRDAASNLWYTPASGQYRKLAGPGTAGAFHAIAPVRVYDSRSALPTPGKLVTGDSRVVSVKDGRNQDTGVVTAADAIPAGATAVAYNITVTQTETGGYLSVVPGDATAQSGSVINWFGTNQDLANGLIGKLDGSRQFKVFTGGAGATHFVIDVSGYFL
ncbi:MAG: hypothetical protein JWM34_2638 [Ilumatobacteraceae bacterium]|nr:hypothetical protein [Ilumatobacteraceae bacterium]